MTKLTTVGEILFADNDMIFEVRGLANELTGSYLNSATVACTLKDSAGAAVTGQSWPLTLAYVTSSNGVYRATLPYTLDLTANGRYTLELDVNAGAGLRGKWEIPCLCRARM
jgi:hypothetical protein